MFRQTETLFIPYVYMASVIKPKKRKPESVAIYDVAEISLGRLGLDYVDIFYSHRFDADTPLEETAIALADIVRQGKALYIGISSYSAGKTAEIAALLEAMNVPLLIHQPSYNLFNRWIERDLLDTTDALGAGVIVFTALAQGLLSDKYLNGIPADARVNRAGGGSLLPQHLSQANIARARALNEIARQRGQSLAQLALAWTLRDPRVSSALIGASRPEQITENVAALDNLAFTAEELAANDSDLRELTVPTGTGPFRFVENIRGEKLTMEANPNYWNPELPYVDGIEMIHVAAWVDRGTAVLTGQADISWNVASATTDAPAPRAAWTRSQSKR